MQIKILFDSFALDGRFFTGWGFSCIIDNRILFDTGENEEYLFANMKKMGIDIADIETVVISHDHWDHTRGLWGLLRKKRDIVVYSCPGFDSSFRKNAKLFEAEIIESNNFYQIKKNIYTTGEIYAKYKGSHTPEQALVIKTVNGISVITGCAHPGVIKILDKIKQRFPKERIYSVLGGFHLFDHNTRSVTTVIDGLRKAGVKKVGPAHCTGKNATGLFKKEYKTGFIEVKVGRLIRI